MTARAQGQGQRVAVTEQGAARAVQFCHVGKMRRRGHEWPSGLRWHATVDGERTLCGAPVPQPKDVGRTHAVRWKGLGHVRCQRCRAKLLGDLWVEAQSEAELRVAEQVLLLGLDLPLLGLELFDHGTRADADDSGWPSLSSRVFVLAVVVHVADGADAAQVHAVLRGRLTALLHETGRRTSTRNSAVNLCVRHSTPEDDWMEAAWRLGGGPFDDTPQVQDITAADFGRLTAADAL